MRSWFGGGHSRNASTASLSSLDQLQELENALSAGSHIMNDDIDLAEAELSKGVSAFHKLGLGLVGFMRAVLGFERQVMAEAQERLTEAENVAYESYKHSQRHKSSSQTIIYSPGTEYLVCQAEVQIMSAVTVVLSESITESLKGFYKLRKAYITLDTIMAEEKKYMDALEAKTGRKVDLESSSTSANPSTVPSETASQTEPKAMERTDPAKDDSDDEQFFDTAQDQTQIADIKAARETTELSQTLETTTLNEKHNLLRRLSSTIQEGPDAEIFTNPIDAFIHSSTAMCAGMLQILISMLPPAFSPLARVIGFSGDRKKGISLLWQASKFGNLNSAFAGLVLLGYYNGFVGFCDILPQTGSEAYPKDRCIALLQDFRKRYPQSCLWMLEEARVASMDQELEKSIQMIQDAPESKLKQILALQNFEMSLNHMFLHQYEPCADAFQKMVNLNNWSHGLYYYIAAISHVERYRELLPADAVKAAGHKETAIKLFAIVPDHIGKKKIMARQLPFDVFVSRKLQKWQARAQENNIDMVDAIGVSPIAEMVYFWNGYKKMTPDLLEHTIKKLDWSTTSSKVPWATETSDEKAIYATLKATVLRNLKRTTESRELIEEFILNKDKNELKGGLKDNWTSPVAHYEMGVSYWVDYLETGDVARNLEMSQEFLDKAASWEAYDLDARVGMRIKTGQVTVKRTLEASSPPNTT